MNTTPQSKISYFKTSALGLVAIFLAISLLIYPDEAFNASLQGLKIWWDIIFPALLPFFITSEILLGFGVVHFMGVLLQPLMKPLFNVPGAGAFVLAMGFASGYPMGAKLTARLREQDMISRIEGERLVSFTSTSDPLFLFGAIAVGFFHDVKLGVFIALVHYSSSILVGLMMKFYHKNSKSESIYKSSYKSSGNILFRAFKAMHQSRLADGRKFGRLMGDAVMSSIETLLMIGGFIMLFSVVLAILLKVNFALIIANLFKLILLLLGISTELSKSLVYGLFEVTLGAKTASEVAYTIPLVQKIAIVGFISAWSGISVHAQVAAILQKTDIRYLPFLLARIMQALIAFFISFALWKPLNIEEAVFDLPVFMYNIPKQSFSFSLWEAFSYIGIFLSAFLALLLALSFCFHFFQKKNT